MMMMMMLVQKLMRVYSRANNTQHKLLTHLLVTLSPRKCFRVSTSTSRTTWPQPVWTGRVGGGRWIVQAHKTPWGQPLTRRTGLERTGTGLVTAILHHTITLER